MNPIFTKISHVKPNNQRHKDHQGVNKSKTQIQSVSDDETYNNEDEANQYQMILDINDIMKTIPGNARQVPDHGLTRTHTEWRWRFFNVKGRKLIEISQKQPHDHRMYVDNTGTWIRYPETNGQEQEQEQEQEQGQAQAHDMNLWDKYVTKVAYHYVVQ
jgi:hypothetical protein